MLPLSSVAFVCSGRGGATGGEDVDGDGDLMLLAEQTISPISSYLHLFWSFCFLSLRCWLRYPGLLLRVPVFVSVCWSRVLPFSYSSSSAGSLLLAGLVIVDAEGGCLRMWLRRDSCYYLPTVQYREDSLLEMRPVRMGN